MFLYLSTYFFNCEQNHFKDILKYAETLKESENVRNKMHRRTFPALFYFPLIIYSLLRYFIILIQKFYLPSTKSF